MDSGPTPGSTWTQTHQKSSTQEWKETRRSKRPAPLTDYTTLVEGVASCALTSLVLNSHGVNARDPLREIKISPILIEIAGRINGL
jgi:hypothetical protein